MVITFLFKTYQNKPDLHVFNCSRRGCYLTGAKFWQRNCKAISCREWRGDALNIHVPFAFTSCSKAKTLACTKTIPAATEAI